MSITTAKHHKGIPLHHHHGGGGASPASAVPQHSHGGGGGHAGYGGHGSGNSDYDANGVRYDGMKKIKGPKPHAPFSNLDAHEARQMGARDEWGVAPSRQRFQGQTSEDIAADLHRQGLRVNSRTKELEPDDNVSSRIKNNREATTAAAHAAHAGNTTNPNPAAGEGSGPSTDNNALFGLPPEPPAAGEGSGPSNMPPQARDAAGRLTDASNVRQPVAPVGDGEYAKDSQGNRASDSNPPVGTPAEFRQMSRDAANGRTVKTGGTTGLTPSADGGRPTQASDFRRTITSKYGTGSNVTRQPGQAPGTVTDSMGRTVPAQQWNQDQADVQATKMGPNAKQAGDNFYNPASIRQSASTPSAAAPQKAATPAPTSTGPVGMSSQDINSAFSPDLPASTGPVGMSSQDIGKAFGSSPPAPADSISNAMGNSAPPAPAGSLGSSMDSGLTTAGTGMSPTSIRQSANPDAGMGTGMGTGMGPVAIRQSAAGAPAATVAQSPMDPDQKALADAKKKIKEADPGEDPDDVIEREAQGED